FARSLEDFRRRNHYQVEQADDTDIQVWWARRQSLFEHLARTADQFWIAEEAGAAIGYARSIRREDSLELTEFFVLPGSQSAEVMDALRAIDREILGYTRDADHVWLSQTRRGHLYRRGGRAVGYGYVASPNGPFALLDGADYPAALAQAEALAAARGDDEAGF